MGIPIHVIVLSTTIVIVSVYFFATDVWMAFSCIVE